MRFDTAAAAAIVAAGLIFPHAASAASSPYGVWLNDTGRGAIEIKNCGSALCGHVVWVKSNTDTKGCGKQIIGESRSVGGNRWDGGWIYSPEKRRRYNVELKPLSDSRLQVVGYAGMKLFSRTMIWKRAPGDLQRCDRPTIEAAKAAPTTAPAAEKPVAVAAVKTAETPERAPPPAAAIEKPAVAQQPAMAAITAVKPAREAAAAASADAAAAEGPAPDTNATRAPAGNAAADRLDEPSGDTAHENADAAASGDDETATAGADEEGNTDTGDSATAPMAEGGLRLGDIELDKIITRSGNGKCKLDLPWVKVRFDCDR